MLSTCTFIPSAIRRVTPTVVALGLQHVHVGRFSGAGAVRHGDTSILSRSLVCPATTGSTICTGGGTRTMVGQPVQRHDALALTQPTTTHTSTPTGTIQTLSPLSALSATVASLVDDLVASVLGGASSILLIKRTYQPSIIRKRRKHGFLERHRSVGGRRVLKRRRHKGRARLGGC
mmetsp:Transcript_34499/g.75508  ORF Transcript_34499/g.75508 Transcript_34499/m.75508 type:complete len:176 (+) Transcript_34499:115-642(+)